MVAVDVRLRREVCDFAVGGMLLSPTEMVLVHDIRQPAAYSSGLTELDALGAFRKSVAFLCDVTPDEVALNVAETC